MLKGTVPVFKNLGSATTMRSGFSYGSNFGPLGGRLGKLGGFAIRVFFAFRGTDRGISLLKEKLVCL